MQAHIAPKYRAVHNYALRRQKDKHDVFGWFPAEDGPVATAVLQIDPDADEASFPRTVGGVRLRLWKAKAPATY